MYREDYVGCLGVGLGIAAIIGVVVAFAVSAQKDIDADCAKLHSLYGAGRCVTEYRGETKLVLPDGTPRYLPGEVEAR